MRESYNTRKWLEKGEKGLRESYSTKRGRREGIEGELQYVGLKESYSTVESKELRPNERRAELG